MGIYNVVILSTEKYLPEMETLLQRRRPVATGRLLNDDAIPE